MTEEPSAHPRRLERGRNLEALNASLLVLPLVLASCGRTSADCESFDCSGLFGEGDLPAGSGGEGTGGALSTQEGDGSEEKEGEEEQSRVSRCDLPGVRPVATSELWGRDLDRTLEELLGVTTLSAHDGQRPSDFLRETWDTPLAIADDEVYATLAAAVTAEVFAGPLRTEFVSCEVTEIECLAATLWDFCQAAFRRHLSEEEIALLIEQNFLHDVDPEGAAQSLLTNILSDQRFWRRDFSFSDAETGLLIGRSLAVRLAYFLQGTMPDEELYAAADTGQLVTKDHVVTQVERLLSTGKARETIAHFHRLYLGMESDEGELSRWEYSPRDPELFPHFDEETYASAFAETEIFFDYLVFNEGNFQDLFVSPVAFVDENLAPLYSLNADDFGAEPEQTNLDPQQRGGFLSRVGFLSSYACFDRTSPTSRGWFVNYRILGLNPGRPHGPEEDGIDPADPYSTNRERIEILTSSPTCVACHSYVGPPGFALENYSASGLWQRRDPLGGAIDPVAEVAFDVDEFREIASPRELMEELAASKRARNVYLNGLLQYAFEKHVDPGGDCFLDEVDLEVKDQPLFQLWLDIATSDWFRKGEWVAD